MSDQANHSGPALFRFAVISQVIARIHGGEQLAEAVAQEKSRCHWHFSRDLSYSLWRDGVSKEERDDEKENSRRMLAIELSAEDMEELSPEK